MRLSLRKNINRTALCLLLAFCMLVSFACGAADSEETTRKKKKPVTTTVETVEDPDSEKIPPVSEDPDGGFTVMNFDLDSVDPSDASTFIDHYHPDFFGVQNADALLLSSISPSEEDYTCLVSGEGKGKHNALYFKTDCFEIVRNKNISLTAAPLERNEGDAELVYALLDPVASDGYIALFSTSLDSGEELEQQMFYLYSKFRCYTSYYTTVVMGALRSPEGSEGYEKLTSGGMLTYGTSSEAGDIYVCCAENVQGTAVTSDGIDSEASLVTAVAVEPPYSIDLDGKMIALTFDDGPQSTEGLTDKILSVLEEHNAKATFFLIGKMLTPNNPIQRSLAAREHELGHETGNHTYDHKSYGSFANEKALLQNLADADALIEECTGGFKATLLRPPGGTVKQRVNVDRPIINWNVDTNDWNISKYTPDDVYAHVVNYANDGFIVLMHDVRHNSPGAIEDIMTWLDNNDYQCVTVSELMEFSDVQMSAGYIYRSAEYTERVTFG